MRSTNTRATQLLDFTRKSESCFPDSCLNVLSLVVMRGLLLDLISSAISGGSYACAPSKVDAETLFTIKPYSSCNFSD